MIITRFYIKQEFISFWMKRKKTFEQDFVYLALDWNDNQPVIASLMS